jgi:hypothetical protein
MLVSRSNLQFKRQIVSYEDHVDRSVSALGSFIVNFRIWKFNDQLGRSPSRLT